MTISHAGTKYELCGEKVDNPRPQMGEHMLWKLRGVNEQLKKPNIAGGKGGTMLQREHILNNLVASSGICCRRTELRWVYRRRRFAALRGCAIAAGDFSVRRTETVSTVGSQRDDNARTGTLRSLVDCRDTKAGAAVQRLANVHAFFRRSGRGEAGVRSGGRTREARKRGERGATSYISPGWTKDLRTVDVVYRGAKSRVQWRGDEIVRGCGRVDVGREWTTGWRRTDGVRAGRAASRKRRQEGMRSVRADGVDGVGTTDSGGGLSQGRRPDNSRDEPGGAVPRPRRGRRRAS
ncbi:hypothetical protein DFH09DRAFT_1289190 [Mycena vulgaris]|nr:hypothetical protein DFH09DRAFT_1289190 [Mycena vulgaris]